MMRAVYAAKDAWSVHPAMRPVEVGVVRDDHQHETRSPVHPSVLGRLGVNPKETVLGPVVDTESDEGENARRNDRVTQLVPTLVRPRQAIAHAAQSHGAGGDEQKHAADNQRGQQIAPEIESKDS